jgi:hypothetical protein
MLHKMQLMNSSSVIDINSLLPPLVTGSKLIQPLLSAYYVLASGHVKREAVSSVLALSQSHRVVDSCLQSYTVNISVDAESP